MEKIKFEKLTNEEVIKLKDLAFEEFCRRNLHLPPSMRDFYNCVDCGKPIQTNKITESKRCDGCLEKALSKGNEVRKSIDNCLK